jgi:hypothetical protein
MQSALKGFGKVFELERALENPRLCSKIRKASKKRRGNAKKQKKTAAPAGSGTSVCPPDNRNEDSGKNDVKKKHDLKRVCAWVFDTLYKLVAMIGVFAQIKTSLNQLFVIPVREEMQSKLWIDTIYDAEIEDNRKRIEEAVLIVLDTGLIRPGTTDVADKPKNAGDGKDRKRRTRRREYGKISAPGIGRIRNINRLRYNKSRFLIKQRHRSRGGRRE